MLNIDQARAGGGEAPKKKPEVYETEEKKMKISIPEGWSAPKKPSV